MPGILVGLDGSHYSERALEWAAKEAALRQVPLRVLAVHTVPAGWTGRGVAYPEDKELVAGTKTAAKRTTKAPAKRAVKKKATSSTGTARTAQPRAKRR